MRLALSKGYVTNVNRLVFSILYSHYNWVCISSLTTSNVAAGEFTGSVTKIGTIL